MINYIWAVLNRLAFVIGAVVMFVVTLALCVTYPIIYPVLWVLAGYKLQDPSEILIESIDWIGKVTVDRL